MDATEQAALEAFTKSISEAKRAAEDAQKTVGEIKAAQEQIKSDFAKVQQAQHAAVVARQEAQQGTNRELDRYLVKSLDGIDHEGRKSIHTPATGSDAPAIRLRGHWTTMTRGPDVHRFWQWGLLDDPEPKSKAQAELQRVLTLRSIARGHVKSQHSPEWDLMVFDAVKACGEKVERIFADSTNIGAEWIPTNLVPELERAILVPTNLAALFPRRILRPGTTQIPKETGILVAYKGAVPTIDDPANETLSSLGTDNVSVDPVPTAVASQVNRDASADSLIDIAQRLMMHMALAFRFADDNTIINGDTAASHQDTIASWNVRSRMGSTGLGTTASQLRRWTGLRARAYDLTSMTTDQNGVQTYAGLKTALGKLSADSLIQGHQLGNTVCVLTSWEYFFGKLLDFTEFLSWEKVAQLASILTGMVGDVGRTPGGMLPGQVGFLQGMIPICIGYPITGDLATTGLYTGSGSTTGMLQVDRSRFEFVVRQGATVETETNIRNNTVTYVGRERVNFRAQDAVSSSIKDVHWSFNLTY